MFAEALIGAGLVLFRLVEHDATLARAFSMALHLTNTFLLLAALTVTAWRASGGAPVRLGIGRASGATTTAALGAALVTAVSGAVAALGDTLFPAKSLAAGMVEDLSPTAHVFVRLRVLHPVIAIVGAVLVLTAAATARAAAATAAGLANRRAARALSFVLAGLVVAQVAIGVANVVLLAPVAMQLTHLAVADSIWIALVLLVAASSDAPALAAPQRIAAAPSAPLST
jgi:heme A synthase